MYYLAYYKDFGCTVFDARIYEFTIFRCSDENFIIEKARELNKGIFMNITTEHFRVYRSETKTYNKKKTTLVYPTNENPMFH